MSYKCAWRPTEIVHCFGLKRKKSQHMIDIGPHRARPARTPRPDRGTNIIDDRNVRGAFAHAACYAMTEFRAVDNDQNIRLCRDDRIGSFPYAPQDF